MNSYVMARVATYEALSEYCMDDEELDVELAIHTEHLTKIYSKRLIAVNDLNLDVPKGSIFGL